MISVPQSALTNSLKITDSLDLIDGSSELVWFYFELVWYHLGLFAQLLIEHQHVVAPDPADPLHELLDDLGDVRDIDILIGE